MLNAARRTLMSSGRGGVRLVPAEKGTGMTRLRAYTVAEAGRVLGMTSAEVQKAIEHGLLWAFTIYNVTRVPADEVERVQTNVARRQRHEIASQRHTAQG